MHFHLGQSCCKDKKFFAVKAKVNGLLKYLKWAGLAGLEKSVCIVSLFALLITSTESDRLQLFTHSFCQTKWLRLIGFH